MITKTRTAAAKEELGLAVVKATEVAGQGLAKGAVASRDALVVASGVALGAGDGFVRKVLPAVFEVLRRVFMVCLLTAKVCVFGTIAVAACLCFLEIYGKEGSVLGTFGAFWVWISARVTRFAATVGQAVDHSDDASEATQPIPAPAPIVAPRRQQSLPHHPPITLVPENVTRHRGSKSRMSLPVGMSGSLIEFAKNFQDENNNHPLQFAAQQRKSHRPAGLPKAARRSTRLLSPIINRKTRR